MAEYQLQFTEDQINDLWNRRISAEVRALYFADLTNLLSRRKQWIAGLSFFFSSGAAATLLVGMPKWVPILCSVLVAGMSAYVFALNLDQKIRTLVKLHSDWSQLADEYAQLWNHAYNEGAATLLEGLIRHEREVSALGATDAPNDRKRLSHWQDHVFEQHHLALV